MNVIIETDKLEQKIGYIFKDKLLLKQALTHSSFTNEQKIRKSANYERLEFLGDAVLELVTSEYLFKSKQDMLEGEMSKMRASMVCEPSLAYCARKLEIGTYLFLGKGEEATGGRNRDSIIADVMEAIIGAIYLDAGFERVRTYIEDMILVDAEENRLFHDSKTILQEIVQAKDGGQVNYAVISEEGPDHDKAFCVEVYVNGQAVSTGIGRTKKAAEQQAAYQALLKGKNNG